MERTLVRKLNRLNDTLRSMESVLVAYSGGLDSTLVVKVAAGVLKQRVMAVTADSPTFPRRERDAAKKLAKRLKVRHEVIKIDEFKNERFAKNDKNRCYWCKKELFSELRTLAKTYGFKYVVDGANFDDTADWRPGLKAARTLKVRSPLIEAKITKHEARLLSKHLKLPTWDKPSFACLSSRIPYGERISPKKVSLIDKAEEVVRGEGFKQVRVRHYGKTARIEVGEGEIPRLLQGARRTRIVQRLKRLGYLYVTVDLEGYQSGSMNRILGV